MSPRSLDRHSSPKFYNSLPPVHVTEYDQGVNVGLPRPLVDSVQSREGTDVECGPRSFRDYNEIKIEGGLDGEGPSETRPEGDKDLVRGVRGCGRNPRNVDVQGDRGTTRVCGGL